MSLKNPKIVELGDHVQNMIAARRQSVERAAKLFIKQPEMPVAVVAVSLYADGDLKLGVMSLDQEQVGAMLHGVQALTSTLIAFSKSVPLLQALAVAALIYIDTFVFPAYASIFR